MKASLMKLLIFLVLLMTIPLFSDELKYLGMRDNDQNMTLSFGANDYMLNYETPYRLLIFFKRYSYGQQYIMSPIVSDKKEKLLKFLEINSLENYYGNRASDTLKLKNGEIFLYGKFFLEYHHNSVQLELVYINKDNEKKIKVFEKYLDISDIFVNEKLNEINMNKTEGYMGSLSFLEEFTIFTKNKILHQKVQYLNNNEASKQLYEKLLLLFRNEIPKEFFENRK